MVSGMTASTAFCGPITKIICLSHGSPSPLNPNSPLNLLLNPLYLYFYSHLSPSLHPRQTCKSGCHLCSHPLTLLTLILCLQPLTLTWSLTRDQHFLNLSLRETTFDCWSCRRPCTQTYLRIQLLPGQSRFTLSENKQNDSWSSTCKDWDSVYPEAPCWLSGT